jgi:hypothetical protein
MVCILWIRYESLLAAVVSLLLAIECPDLGNPCVADTCACAMAHNSLQG